VLKSGRVTVAIAPRSALRQPTVRPETAPTYDAALFEKLRVLRRQLADAANVPAYVIFSDRSLIEMATYYPQTPERFLDIDGVGRRKLESYGERFLAVIRDHCMAHGLREQPKMAVAGLTGGLAKRRFVEVGELFATGYSIEQLQVQYGVQCSTILNHLAHYQREGGSVDGERVRAESRLSPEQQARVLARFDELGAERLAPIFEALDGIIPYEELHLMRIVYAAHNSPAKTGSSRPPTA
jgi:ATP-dependent DNA helicase RecQ